MKKEVKTCRKNQHKFWEYGFEKITRKYRVVYLKCLKCGVRVNRIEVVK